MVGNPNNDPPDLDDAFAGGGVFGGNVGNAPGGVGPEGGGQFGPDGGHEFAGNEFAGSVDNEGNAVGGPDGPGADASGDDGGAGNDDQIIPDAFEHAAAPPDPLGSAEGRLAARQAAEVAAEKERGLGASAEERLRLKQERELAAEQELALQRAQERVAEIRQEEADAEEEAVRRARDRARSLAEPFTLLADRAEETAAQRFATSPLGLLTNPNVGRPRLLGQ